MSPLAVQHPGKCHFKFPSFLAFGQLRCQSRLLDILQNTPELLWLSPFFQKGFFSSLHLAATDTRNFAFGYTEAGVGPLVLVIYLQEVLLVYQAAPEA